MPRERSPPPSYQSIDQHAPLLPGRSRARTYYNCSSRGVESGAKNGELSRTTRTIILCVLTLLVVGLLCGFLGVFIARSTSTDPSDPAVRRRLLQEWNTQIQQLKSDEQILLARLGQLKRDYKRQDEEWKRKLEKEKRERELARLYWVGIQGDTHCVANGRKNYTAKLANLPWFMDRVEACKATPVTINGITYKTPMNCEDKGFGEGVRGHWTVENEAVCSAYWELTKQKECTAPHSGFRRIEAKFGVVHAGEDRETLCLTTPLTINGQTYERPMACPNWGKYGFWGIWNISDDNCR